MFRRKFLAVIITLAAISVAAGGFVLASTPRKPTLLAFTATWCYECQVDKPTLAKIAQLGTVAVVTVDGDQNPEWVKRWQVGEFPMYIFGVDKSGSEQWRTTSVKDAYNRIVAQRKQ